MAVVKQTIKDSDFEHVVKITTTGTNSAANIVDASALAGHDSGPKLSIVACTWSVGSQTDILFDATSNVVALSLQGNGTMSLVGHNFGAIPNNAGSGVTGDIDFTKVGHSNGDAYSIILNDLP